jgi:hypothetical protein
VNRSGLVRARVEPAAGDRARYRVLAGGQDAGHAVHSLERASIRGSGVDHAIGIEFEKRIRVVAGLDAERRKAAELAGVTPGLLLAVDIDPGQLEFGVPENRAQGVAAGNSSAGLSTPPSTSKILPVIHEAAGDAR